MRGLLARVRCAVLIEGGHRLATRSLESGQEVLRAELADVDVPRVVEDLPAARHELDVPLHGAPPAGSGHVRQSHPLRIDGEVAKVIQAVRKGARSIGDLLSAIYPKLELALIPAARMTLKSHIEYLAARGKIRARWGIVGARVEPV